MNGGPQEAQRNYGSTKFGPQAKSPDGSLVAYANLSALNLYALSDSGSAAKLKVTKKASQKMQLRAMQFTADGKCLVGFNAKNECTVLDARTLQVVHVFAAPGNTSAAAEDELLAVSTDSEYVAVTSSRRSVLVYNLKGKALQGVLEVGTAISFLSFEHGRQHVLVGTANQQVLFYDLKTCSACRDLMGHSQQVAKRLNFISGAVQHVSCVKGKSDTFVMVNTVRGLCFANFSKPIKFAKGKESQHSRKRSRSHGLQLAARQGQNPRILPLEDPCLFACFLSEHSALIVECPWLKALKDVPKPIHRKRYGM